MKKKEPKRAALDGRSPERAAEAAGDREMVAFFWDVVSAVRYRDYMDIIAANDFKQMRLLALWDLWFSYSDDELAEKLWKARHQQTKVKDLNVLRRHEAYGPIREALKASAERLRKVQSLEQVVDDPEVQDAVAREVVRTAIAGSDPKVKERAQAQLTDRMMPPAARKDGGGRLLIVDPSVIAGLLDTAKLVGNQKLLSDEGFVDLKKQ